MTPEPGRRAARLAAHLAALTGWRRLVLAAGLGALAAPAMPPANLVVLLIPAFTGWVWLLDGCRTVRGAAATGWAFGFGFFVVGLYWVGFAFLVDADAHAWMMPLPIIGLPALLALFTAGAAATARWLAPSPGPARLVAVVAAWGLWEWLRTWLLTGFPWNLIGYAWTGSLDMLQATAWIGIQGLGLITVAAAAAPALIAHTRPNRAALAVALPLVVLAGLWGAGALRLADAPERTVADVQLRLVQPAIPQARKWDRDLLPANFRRHLDLSAGPGHGQATHILWPETAAAFFLANDAPALAAVADIVPAGGALVTGAPRAEWDGSGRMNRLWNSMLAIDDQGAIAAVYDKAHLVPFGEYVPLKEWIPFAKIVHGGRDYSPGTGVRTVALPGAPAVSPLICYEVIFPGAVVDPENRPGWLLNLTNDAWYGHTAGPHQHFQITRVRAVEEGLPLVRVANTGISGVVDPYGRVTARLDLGERGVIDAPLPESAPPTLYSRVHDLPLLVVLAITLAALGVLRLRRARN